MSTPSTPGVPDLGHLPTPCLCLVTDRSAVERGTLVSRVARAVEGGVDMVQLREKDLPGGELLRLADDLARAIRGEASLVVNERIDVAMAAGCQGVQLGEEAVPVDLARRVLGPNYLIGRSVHSVDGATKAQSAGADFLVAGTMFSSRTHPGAEPAGPVLVQGITQACNLPVIGIGGITSRNLGEVLAAGASGVAAITSILASPDPREAAREMKQALLETWAGVSPTLRGESSQP